MPAHARHVFFVVRLDGVPVRDRSFGVLQMVAQVLKTFVEGDATTTTIGRNASSNECGVEVGASVDVCQMTRVGARGRRCGDAAAVASHRWVRVVVEGRVLRGSSVGEAPQPCTAARRCSTLAL